MLLNPVRWGLANGPSRSGHEPCGARCTEQSRHPAGSQHRAQPTLTASTRRDVTADGYPLSSTTDRLGMTGDDSDDRYKHATDSGAPVPSVEHLPTVGTDGPILLQDHYLMSRWPTSTGAHPGTAAASPKAGRFRHFLKSPATSASTPAPRCSSRAPGTEMVARFSTVGRAAAQTPGGDPRGFALSSYTSEGNSDPVGNNTPVFIR